MSKIIWQAELSDRQFDALNQMARDQIAEDLAIYFQQLIDERID